MLIDGNEVQIVPDTGSDWNCASPSGLAILGKSEKDLTMPTEEMNSTSTADGKPMSCLGYLVVQFQFGPANIRENLVVFSELTDDFILARDSLENLGIVEINYSPRVRTMTTMTVTKEQLLAEFHDVFEPRDEPFAGEKYHIHLKDNDIPCRVSVCRNIAYAYQDKLKLELDKLQAEGVITPVTKPTEWVNPIVIEPKKGTDEIRL
jgi:hypothetical protein